MKIIKKVNEGFVSTNLDVQPQAYTTKNSLIRALREACTAEIDAANMYEKMVDSIQMSQLGIPSDIVETIQSVANEEKVHLGEFQKCLKLVSMDLDFIDQGMKENA